LKQKLWRLQSVTAHTGSAKTQGESQYHKRRGRYKKEREKESEEEGNDEEDEDGMP